MTPQVERDAHLTQTYWMEIRHIVKKIYREKMSLTSEGGEREREREREEREIQIYIHLGHAV